MEDSQKLSSNAKKRKISKILHFRCADARVESKLIDKLKKIEFPEDVLVLFSIVFDTRKYKKTNEVEIEMIKL